MKKNKKNEVKETVSVLRVRVSSDKMMFFSHHAAVNNSPVIELYLEKLPDGGWSSDHAVAVEEELEIKKEDGDKK